MTQFKIIKPVYLNNTIDEIMQRFSDISTDIFADFDAWKPSTLKFPDYPHSVGIAEDGTTIIEVAAGGFDKKEIKVDVEDHVLSLIGTRDPDGNTNNVHYIYTKLVKKDFNISYKLSDKTDVDNIKVSLDKGILRVEVPVKPECKPVKKSFKIQ